MSASAAAASSAAHAEEMRRQMQEEEELTSYRAAELALDYEFKILRSAMGSFRRPACLQRVLDEEARAGWQLVEKFDDSRLRLKRPASARQRDGKLGFDPYRTYVGFTPTALSVLIIAGCTALVLVVMSFVGLFS